MNDLATIVAEFTKLVADFRYEEAHDRFYDEKLVKHENEDAPTIGLEQHRQEMQQFLTAISNASAQLIQVVVSDDMSVCEWHYQFDHASWGHRDFREISVQRWRNGKIIHERHHYKTATW